MQRLYVAACALVQFLLLCLRCWNHFLISCGTEDVHLPWSISVSPSGDCSMFCGLPFGVCKVVALVLIHGLEILVFSFVVHPGWLALLTFLGE
jgi:hypothetical protein